MTVWQRKRFHVIFFILMHWLQNAGKEQMMFTDFWEFLTTLHLWLNVKQHASIAKPASLLTGNQATLGKPVGFWHYHTLDPPCILEWLVTTNLIQCVLVSLYFNSCCISAVLNLAPFSVHYGGLLHHKTGTTLRHYATVYIQHEAQLP